MVNAVNFFKCLVVTVRLLCAIGIRYVFQGTTMTFLMAQGHSRRWYLKVKISHVMKKVVVVVMVFYSPSTLFRSYWAQSVNLSTLFLDKPPSQFVNQNLVHILSPVTDNCPSWISGREKMVVEIISCLNSMKECCLTWGSNTRMHIWSSYRARQWKKEPYQSRVIDPSKHRCTAI